MDVNRVDKIIKIKSLASLQRKQLFFPSTHSFPAYLWFIHPGGIGPFAICRTEYVGREQGCTMLTVIQAGKMILVFVALAYRLVSCCIDTRWWAFFVEEVKALGEVVTDLSKDGSTKPGQEKEQSSCGELQHLPLRHTTVLSIQTSAGKRYQRTNTLMADFLTDTAPELHKTYISSVSIQRLACKHVLAVIEFPLIYTDNSCPVDDSLNQPPSPVFNQNSPFNQQSGCLLGNNGSAYNFSSVS